MRARAVYFAALLLTALAAFGLPRADGVEDAAPHFEVDPFWPRPLPDEWLLGSVVGVDVDARDHVWIVHRPGTLAEREEAFAATSPPRATCCVAAPPVIEFGPGGEVIQAWGGPGAGYEWPGSEHGIFVDHKDNVWVAGGGDGDHQVLKFSRDGTFLLQIGRAGQTGGSNHETLLGQPADIAVDPETNEVYVADGYLNKRVIVFDAETGAYRRHWGAYGERPDDADPGPYDPEAASPRQFRSPVHAVRIADDGLVYVCDRVNNRIQVFHKDGRFVDEVVIAPSTLLMGAAWDVDFSPDDAQTFLYNVDGMNQHVWTLRREELRILGQFGRHGRYAGQFHWLHSVAVDSHGNLFTGETHTGQRVQKFVYRGPAPRS